MMSSKLVRPHSEETSNRFNLWINRRLEALSGGYRRWLQRNVGKRWLLAAVMLGALALSYGLIRFVPSELAPAEDRGSFFVSVTGPEGAGFDYTVGQMRQVEQIFADNTGEGTAIRRYNTRVPGGWGASEEMHTGNVIVFLQDWDQRERSTAEVAEELRRELSALPGVRAQPRVGGGLVGGRGQPIQIVLGGPEYAEIAGWRDIMMERMEANPGFFSVDSDYKETRPQMRVEIDRQRAADLGVSVSSIGQALETMMGSRRVTTFVQDGEEYDVIVQAERGDRADPADLAAIRVRAGSGELVPLSNLVTLTELAEAGSLNRFNRLRAITITAGLTPGYSMGEALEFLETT